MGTVLCCVSIYFSRIYLPYTRFVELALVDETWYFDHKGLYWFYMPWKRFFDILKVLPLTRWKKEKPPGEKPSAMSTRANEILIIKKSWSQRKMQSESVDKRSRSVSNQTQNLKFVSQRNQYRRWCETSKHRKSGLAHQRSRQGHLLARLESDSNWINRSPHPSLIEDNSRGTNFIAVAVIMWLMCPIKYNGSPQTSVFLRC